MYGMTEKEYTEKRVTYVVYRVSKISYYKRLRADPWPRREIWGEGAPMREEAPDTQGEEGREAWVRCQKGPAQLVVDAMSSEVLGQNGWLGPLCLGRTCIL